MSDELATIATFNEATEAHLAKAQLEEAGIGSVVIDEHFTTTYGSVLAGGVKLQVKAGDVQLAQTVLEHGGRWPDHDVES